jgi:DnaJ-class molecular chaperone
MTLPWADPNKCDECGGCGLVVRQVRCNLYTCGFTTKAGTCSVCLGSGRKMPVPVDVKLLAAGGER